MTKHFHLTSSCHTPILRKKEIVSLDTNKSTHSNNVPTKIVKASADLFSNFVSNAFHKSFISCTFFAIVKSAAIIPVHKKKSKLEKSNYRPVSLLPNISKLFERCMHRQIQNIFKLYFRNFNVDSEKVTAPKIVYLPG